MTVDPNGPYGIDMVELCFEIFILCWCLSVLFFLLWRINTKMRLGMFSLIGWSAALFLVISLIMGIALYIMEKIAQVMVKVSPKDHVKNVGDYRNLSFSLCLGLARKNADFGLIFLRSVLSCKLTPYIT